MVNNDQSLNELFKRVYAEDVRRMLSDSYEYITVKNTSLARKLYAGKLGGFTEDSLLIKREVVESKWSQIIGISSPKRGGK